MEKEGKVGVLCGGRDNGRTLQQYLEVQKWAVENGFEKVKLEFITPEYINFQELIDYLKERIENYIMIHLVYIDLLYMGN